MQNEKKVLLAMARRKLCQDAIDNDKMEPPFVVLTTDRHGKTASEHSVTLDAEREFIEREIRGAEGDTMDEPFDLKLIDAKKKTKERELNFI
jgi:hypothetical protein